jgi:hypothetical protein
MQRWDTGRGQLARGFWRGLGYRFAGLVFRLIGGFLGLLVVLAGASLLHGLDVSRVVEYVTRVAFR